jgi:sterol desaturase/sphingolipid hydroxylase (fatty acid hydroxylase superfamily)
VQRPPKVPADAAAQEKERREEQMILIMLTAILAGTLVLAVILTALLCWALATPAFCGGTVALMWLLLLIVFVAVNGIDPRD